MYFCLSQVHVIVSCFSHFWNENSESLGCLPVQFLDAHMLREKQTVVERRWTRAADVKKREKVKTHLECTSVVFIMCLTLFIFFKWNLRMPSESRKMLLINRYLVAWLQKS